MNVPEWYILLSMLWVGWIVFSSERNCHSIDLYKNDDVRIWVWSLLLLIGLEIMNNFRIEDLSGFWGHIIYIHVIVLKLGLYVFLFINMLFKPHVLLSLIVPFILLSKNAEDINNWLIKLTNQKYKPIKGSLSIYLFWHGFLIGVAGITLSSVSFIWMNPYWEDFLPNIIMDCLIAPILFGGYGFIVGSWKRGK